MRKPKILGSLLAGGFLILAIGSGCAPTKKWSNDRVHINEEECQAFMLEVAPDGQLFFSGQSKFIRDVNEAKLQAFNNAQAAMARSVKSSISSACKEKTSYSATSQRTRKKMEQECETAIKTENIDVSDISGNRSYCLETKKFTTGGIRKTIYRQTARIQVDESRFLEFIKQQSP